MRRPPPTPGQPRRSAPRPRPGRQSPTARIVVIDGLDGRPSAGRVERVVEPVGPLGERDPLVLALVEQAAGQGVGRARQSVEVLVEERDARPAYSAISVKLGLLTTSAMPRPTAKPLANCVLPAPSGPTSASRSPGRAATASAAASARVRSADVLSPRHDALARRHGRLAPSADQVEPLQRRRAADTGARRRPSEPANSTKPPGA